MMPYKDIREFLAKLESDGELLRVEEEVDPKYEVSVIQRIVSESGGPALIFENLKGYRVPLVCNVYGTLRRLLLALETTEDKIYEELKGRIEQIGSIKVLDDAPSKQVVLHGDKADLTKFPIPTWTAKDGGPYIVNGVAVMKNPDTNYRNVGVYRIQILGPNEAKIYFLPIHHAGMILKRYEELNKTMELAIAIGVEPAIWLTAMSPSHPFGERNYDRFERASAIKTAPIELIKCETVDLEVPATAEIVIESEVFPLEKIMDGPFPECYGYYNSGEARMLRVKAITHRDEPIYEGSLSPRPPRGFYATIPPMPAEKVMIRNVWHIDVLSKARKQIPELVDFSFLPTWGCDILVASIKKTREGLPRKVMMQLWSLFPEQSKIIIVVDDDINIRDSNQVWWALSSRFYPEKDFLLIPGPLEGTPMAPSIRKYPNLKEMSKLGIDATKPLKGFPEPIAYFKETIEKVKEKWKRYGFKEELLKGY